MQAGPNHCYAYSDRGAVPWAPVLRDALLLAGLWGQGLGGEVQRKSRAGGKGHGDLGQWVFTNQGRNTSIF